jgi:hypothetical protein
MSSLQDMDLASGRGARFAALRASAAAALRSLRVVPCAVRVRASASHVGSGCPQRSTDSGSGAIFRNRAGMTALVLQLLQQRPLDSGQALKPRFQPLGSIAIGLPQRLQFSRRPN